MKYKLGILFGSLVMTSLSANAQNSVTLYGIIDVGVNMITNAGGHHQYAMTSGVNNGSRWGLLGTEDLGGGLKALFRLENGFDATSGTLGQGGRMFGRQAWVGLGSNYGTVTLGRQYDSLVDAVGNLSVASQWGGYVSAHPGDLDNYNNTYRINNSVKYTSPKFGGIVFSGLYSFGGVAGDTSRSQIWSVGARYSSGPLTAGVGYLNARNPNLSLFGSNASSVAATTASSTSPVYSGYLSAHSYQSIGTGLQYVYGPATFGLTYSNVKFMALGDTSSGPNPNRYSGTATFNNAEVNFNYFVTPDFQVGAAYQYTDGDGGSNNPGAKYHQGEAVLNYFFSKRTTVYLLGVYQHASGTDSRNQPAVAAINLLTPSTSSNQTFVRVGLRTKF